MLSSLNIKINIYQPIKRFEQKIVLTLNIIKAIECLVIENIIILERIS